MLQAEFSGLLQNGYSGFSKAGLNFRYTKISFRSNTLYICLFVEHSNHNTADCVELYEEEQD